MSHLTFGPDHNKAIPGLNETEILNNNRNICYDALVNNEGKFYCPKCNMVEGGTMRIITHKFGCINRDKEYCQKSQKGGKQKSRRNKHKSRKNRRKTNRRGRK